ncbi:MAG: ankyrin repeat domain-containing protein [Candidatus Aquirickettsiella sp.]
MNNTELNQLLKKAFCQECIVVGSLDTSYQLKFSSRLTESEFTKFVDDCKKFLFQYDIEIGSIFAINPGKLNSSFIVQICQLPSPEKLAEKLDALTTAIQLHEAANTGNLESVKKLLHKHMDVNNKNIVGETALHLAARKGYDKIITLLLENGASIKSVNYSGETAVHLAVQTHYVATLKKLLAVKGLEINSKDLEGNTYLHLAVRLGNPEIITQLFEYDIDSRIQNNEGETALHVAASVIEWAGDRSIKLILDKIKENSISERPEIINIQNYWGATALHLLEYETGSAEAIDMLLKAGADVNLKTKEGETVLHIAAKFNDVTATLLLLEKQAEVNCYNSKRETPLLIADQLKNIDVGKILIGEWVKQDSCREKPIFGTQELSDYWDEQRQKLIDKSGIQRAKETQEIKNIMQFFSDILPLQPVLDIEDGQQIERYQPLQI